MQTRNFIDERREAAEMYWELLNATPHMRRSLQKLNSYLQAYDAGKVNPLPKPSLPSITDPEQKKSKLLF